jgi:glycerophosphoryl diester phosphodiesterase
MNQSVLKIGHRGTMCYEPENTLAFIQKAIDLGCDIVEIDVHLCKSGELILIHDDTLEITTKIALKASSQAFVLSIINLCLYRSASKTASFLSPFLLFLSMFAIRSFVNQEVKILLLFSYFSVKSSLL